MEDRVEVLAIAGVTGEMHCSILWYLELPKR